MPTQRARLPAPWQAHIMGSAPSPSAGVRPCTGNGRSARARSGRQTTSSTWPTSLLPSTGAPARSSIPAPACSTLIYHHARSTNLMLNQARAMQNQLTSWRRDFHQHPELGFEEVRTAGIVAAELRRLGLPVQTGVGKTGVVASIGEGSPVVG